MGKILWLQFELWIYAPYDFSPRERKFLVTAWWVCVTQAITPDWGLGLNPGSLPTCFFTLLFLLHGRGQAVGTLVFCAYRHHKSNRLKPFGSRTGAHSGAQLTEACLPSLCLSPEWSPASGHNHCTICHVPHLENVTGCLSSKTNIQ